MGSSSETILLGNGRLIKTPTDNTTAPNYGGTRLGTVQDFQVEINRITYQIRAEEHGGAVIKTVNLRSEVLVSATFQNWDQDAVVAACYNASTNTTVPTVTFPEDPGTSGASKFLFVPDDATNQPAVMIYSAAPFKITNPVRWSGFIPTELRVEWKAQIGDDADSNRVFVMDKLSRITV